MSLSIFDAEARKHRKACKYLLVGRSHKKAADDFSAYARTVNNILDHTI
jgi:hypothetical protein